MRNVAHGHEEIGRLAHACALAFGVPPAAVISRTRGSVQAALARQVLMYLAVVTLELAQERVAAALGRRRQTVAHALMAIEDRRDDRAFDELIGKLELKAAP